MAHTVERLSPCRVGITATVDAEQTAAARERVTSAWVRRAVIDGFRPGKAPRSLVERRFAKEIAEELEEALLHVAWDEVRASAALRPAGPLQVQEARLEPDGGFRMSGQVEVYPEVVVGPLAGFVPPPFEVEPSAEEIEAQLAQLRERQVAWEPVSGEVAREGLLAEVEIFGEFPDGGGEPFHEERSLFQLGAGEVHPEIEAAVLGHAVGEEVRAERKLGEEAGPGREGKRIVYRLVIKGLRRKQLPELDDAFAASLGVENGLEGLRQQVRLRLRRGKLQQRYELWREAVVTHLLGGRSLELPPRLVEEETHREVVRFARSLAEVGVDVEKAELDWQRIEREAKGRVERRLRHELVLDAAAAALGVQVEDAEVDVHVAHEAKALGVPFAELRGNLVKSGGLGRMRAALRQEKVLRLAVPELEAEPGAAEGKE